MCNVSKLQCSFTNELKEKSGIRKIRCNSQKTVLVQISEREKLKMSQNKEVKTDHGIELHIRNDNNPISSPIVQAKSIFAVLLAF